MSRTALAACALAVLSTPLAAAPPPPAAAPFKADAAAAAQLPSVPTPLGMHYAIRLPMSLKAIRVSDAPSGGEEQFGFATAKHANGANGKIIIAFLPMPKPMSSADASPELDKMLTGLRNDTVASMARPQIGAIENGEIDGMPFAKVHVTGTVTVHLPGHETTLPTVALYLGYDNTTKQVIDVFAADTAPTSAKLIPQMDAAVLSLTRR